MQIMRLPEMFTRGRLLYLLVALHLAAGGDRNEAVGACYVGHWPRQQGPGEKACERKALLLKHG